MIDFFNKLFNYPRLGILFLKMRPFLSRYFFLIISILGLMWHAVYTNYIIGRLQKDARIYTSMQAELISEVMFDKIDKAMEQFVLDRILSSSDVPIIITTKSWEPIIWRNIYNRSFFKKEYIDLDDSSFATIELVKQKVKRFRRKFDPKIVYGRDKKTEIGYLVYGQSSLIKGLAWMPFFEAVFIIIFSTFVYFALHNIIITERSNLWVGLAKETAHQLGTPISSLMGWVEYIRAVRGNSDDKDDIDPKIFIAQVHDICNDMDKDLTRLKKITNRFSQIGSKPNLKIRNINEIINDNIRYFKTRLPLLGKHIQISTTKNKVPLVGINKDLMGWVLENLFKNSVDSIKEVNGEIKLFVEYIEVDSIVRIHHIDNGNGISWDSHQSVFAAGYTTKRRGWGLGLALAKRIVEDYHNGRIYIAWSQKGKGTEFCIDLPVDRSLHG